MAEASRIEFVTPHQFNCGGFRFCFAAVQATTTPDMILLLKDRSFVDAYQHTLTPLAPRRVFEFGIFQGGSAIFLTSLWKLEKYVCLDICDRVEAFEGILSSHPIGERIRTYYNTSQDNDVVVREILEREFAEGELDMIIDDASHAYDLTKRSFEIAFPYLRDGGCYVIEDWSWAHWPENQNSSVGWGAWTAMSNLIIELVLLLPSSDLIESITVRQGFVVIQKRDSRFRRQMLNIDGQLRLRGRALNKI